MKNKFNKINTKTEFKHIFSFIDATWVLNNKLSKDIIFNCFYSVFKAGLLFGKDFCNSTELKELIQSKIKNPQDCFLEENFKHKKNFDSLFHFTTSMLSGLDYFIEKSIDNSEYDKKIKEIYSQTYLILQDNTVYPRTYGKYADLSYQTVSLEIDDDFFDYYHLKLDGKQSESELNESRFKGHIFNNLRGFNFISATTLHYILESDLNQGRNPLKELTSAIFQHGINVAEYNNTIGSIEFFHNTQFEQAFYKDALTIPNVPLIEKCLTVTGYDKFKSITEKQEKLMDLLDKSEKELTEEEKLLLNDAETVFTLSKIKLLAKSFISNPELATFLNNQ